MAQFDFIESAADGYRFFWKERVFLTRLSILPFLVKIISFFAIPALGLEENYLRQGLVFLPSYILEAWLVVQAIGFYRFGQAWFETAPDPALATARKQSAQAAMGLYVLIKLIVALIAGLGMGLINIAAPTAETQADASSFKYLLLILFLAALLWGFRLIWVYILPVLGYSIMAFLKKVRGLMISVHMLGTWFLCFIPVALALMITSEVLLAIFPIQGDTPQDLYLYVISFFQSIAEIIIALTTSVAVARGMRAVMEGRNEKTKRL